MAQTISSPLDRLLSPLATELSPEAARKLVDYRVDPGTQARIRILAEKANEGQLSPDERAEYMEFVEGIDLIGILQAKAREALARQAV